MTMPAVLTCPFEIRANNARCVMDIHDAMEPAWRDLCNEFGELAVQLFEHEAPVDLAAEFLFEERENDQDEMLSAT